MACSFTIIHPNLRYSRGLDQSLHAGGCEGCADDVDSKLCHRSSNGHAFGLHLPCGRLLDEQLPTDGKCGRGAPHWPLDGSDPSCIALQLEFSSCTTSPPGRGCDVSPFATLQRRLCPRSQTNQSRPI